MITPVVSPAATPSTPEAAAGARPATSSSPPDVVHIGGVPVHRVDLAGAVRVVDQFIAEGTPHYNIAINAAKVTAFHDDPALRRAIEDAHLLTADGQPIVWSSRLFRRPIPARASGADLMELLLAHAAEQGYSVYLLGARDEIVRACVERAQSEHPRLRVAGFRNGYFRGEAETEQVLTDIRRARPDILFLGFGSPAKELFMHRHYRDLGVPFTMGVGGTFDVYAGLTRRAPRWMQETGLEWLYRTLQEPRRMWKRYLVGNSRFVWLVVREAVRSRRAGAERGPG